MVVVLPAEVARSAQNGRAPRMWVIMQVTACEGLYFTLPTLENMDSFAVRFRAFEEGDRSAST